MFKVGPLPHRPAAGRIPVTAGGDPLLFSQAAMKPVFVLQHVPHESLGTIAPWLDLAGLDYRCVELFGEVPGCLDLEEAAGLVVMGGPMNVNEVDCYPFLATEIDWIAQAVARDLPVLGVCLGAQLLAKALGARVYANPIKEIGWYEITLAPEAADDLLFGDCPSPQVVFQWHGDTFELPFRAVALASGESCPNQAFRFGRSAYGLQFHVEMTAEMIDEWLDDPENRAELARLDHVDPAAIRARTPECLPRMQALAGRILPRFAAMCLRHA